MVAERYEAVVHGQPRAEDEVIASVRHGRRMGWRRQILFRGITIGIGLVAALLVAEIGLRFAGFSGVQGSRYSMPDDELSWVNRPLADVEVRGIDYRYEVRVNSQGFRGSELRKSASSRIMMIGDSMVFGQGVDDHETFPSQLQKLLDLAGHAHIEVVNAGVIAYGSLQAKGLALRKWEVVKPRVVIFTHTGNDLADDLRFSKGYYKRMRNAVPGREFLKEHSALYNVAKRPVLALLSKIGMYNPPLRFESQTEGAAVSDVGHEPGKAKAIFSDSLRELKAICRERGAQFFVTTVGFWSEDKEIKFSSQAQWVKSISEENDIPFLDPTVAFPNEETDHWRNQSSIGHYSPLGNQLFARSLYAGLTERGVLGTLGESGASSRR